jgi:four helix bundle protein
MRNDKENLIVKLSLDFAIIIVEFAELLESKKKYVVAKQILKSGTSIGANIHEAQNAESKNDFIHKLKIAAKEADETAYWLIICQLSKNYPNCEKEQEKLQEIIKIISKIIATSKANQPKTQN